MRYLYTQEGAVILDPKPTGFTQSGWTAATTTGADDSVIAANGGTLARNTQTGALYRMSIPITVSPLQPLQDQLAAIVNGAAMSGAVDAQAITTIATRRAAVENLFSKWREMPLSLLRESIRLQISPPPDGQLDFSGFPILEDFQQRLLAAPNWSDPLPEED